MAKKSVTKRQVNGGYTITKRAEKVKKKHEAENKKNSKVRTSVNGGYLVDSNGNVIKSKGKSVIKKNSKKNKKGNKNKKNRSNSGGYIKQSSSASRCTLYCKNHKLNRKTLTAQFNPTKLPYSFGANYAEITAPGMNYPVFQYVGGKSCKFTIELYFHDIPYTGSIAKDKKWLRKLVPPRKNKKKVFTPPIVDFRWGYFSCKFVTESISVEDELLDSDGRQLITKITLGVILVGSTKEV